MAEYIEREALMERLESLTIIIEGLRIGKSNIAEFAIRYKNSILRAINEFPAADVEPVRRGRWNADGRCTVCGGHAPFYAMSREYYKSDYCFECGARMDLEVSE